MIPAPHATAPGARCEHARAIDLVDAERHFLAGESRVWCPACGSWVWAGLYRRWPSPLRVLASADPASGWRPGP